MIKSVGLFGYGNFGAFVHLLAQRYAPELAVKINSRSRMGDGDPFVSLEEAAACDAVILTVPIGAYEATLERIKPHLRPDTVIVDVATVKKYSSGLIRSIA
ncbi:MAG TPA: prephenate dehydrogenase/arogenate dehydrogenase family protein, partial [Afifellaceae bacterium]|nr:prephenate dehydrogenase/arogenate dehydrogenase family protein [Afifellaceae bacterium]